MRTPTVPVLAAALALSFLGGCSGTRQGFDLNATSTPATFSSRPTVQVYTAMDRNTADFYMTDLPSAEGDPRGLTGSLVHLHLFLQPRAGQTPIADEACSFTVRQVVFAGGQVGVYSGGGFLTLSGDLGQRACGGVFRGATLRLTQSTPGFADKLGPCTMNGGFRAGRDDKAAAAWSQLMSRTLEACGPEKKAR